MGLVPLFVKQTLDLKCLYCKMAVSRYSTTIILHYLKEKWSDQVPLLLRNSAARAEARIIKDMCDTHYKAINWSLGEVVWMGRAEGGLAEHLKNTASRQIKEIFM